MRDLVWQDPPPKRRTGKGDGEWAHMVARLKAHPGEWALLFSGVSGGGGYRAYFTSSGITITQRSHKDNGLLDLYGCYQP